MTDVACLSSRPHFDGRLGRLASCQRALLSRGADPKRTGLW